MYQGKKSSNVDLFIQLMTFITRLPTNFSTSVIQRQRRFHDSLRAKSVVLHRLPSKGPLLMGHFLTVSLRDSLVFPLFFCLPHYSTIPSSRAGFLPSRVSLLEVRFRLSCFTPPRFLLSFTTPWRSQRCFNNCICYQVSLWKANLRKPWKPDGLVFKFDSVVSPPSGLKSFSLSLELFQFPVRRYLNIWRFWSFWFICRKYRNILVQKNSLWIILPPIKAGVF